MEGDGAEEGELESEDEGAAKEGEGCCPHDHDDDDHYDDEEGSD